jgi:hypothetical protein
MTASEKISQLVRTLGPTPTTPDGLLVLAYYMGREEAARRLCDEHNKRVAAMRAAADQEHCHHVAHRVITAGGPDQIYSPDYAGDVTSSAQRLSASEEGSRGPHENGPRNNRVLNAFRHLRKVHSNPSIAIGQARSSLVKVLFTSS